MKRVPVHAHQTVEYTWSDTYKEQPYFLITQNKNIEQFLKTSSGSHRNCKQVPIK